MLYHDGGPIRNVGDITEMGADRYGERTAFVFMGQETSYADLDVEANRVANVLLDQGVTPGDRVGLFLPNTSRFPPAYFGAIKMGAVPVPLNLRMGPETLSTVLEDAGVDVVVGSAFLWDTDDAPTVDLRTLHERSRTDTVLVPGIADGGQGVVNLSHAEMEAEDAFETVEQGYDDPAVQLYTSGTTGRPKGVPLTHRNLLSAIEAYDGSDPAVYPEDTALLVLPLFHIYGLNAVMGYHLAAGASMVLQPRPEAGPMLRAIDEHGVTEFAGVPAMYTSMLREYRDSPGEYDLSTLEVALCAAAPLADDVRRTIEDEWNVPMIEGWGMTETAPAGTLESDRSVRKSAGCIGPPLPNVEVKLVDPETRETKVDPDDLYPNPDDSMDFEDPGSVTGEIAVRGDPVFEGYHERPETTAAVFDDEGWFYTDDIARVDRDGYLWMVDRADDMLIVGGENVYPAEIEDGLYDHPAVAEAAVARVDHEVKGEAPVAFVVPEAGTDPTEEEIREFALERVAPYAHPRRVFFVEELPRSATRKVQRYRLEERAEELLDGEPLSSSDEL